MTLTDATFPENAIIERIVVGDDGSVVILYRGNAAVMFRALEENITLDPIPVGTSVQIRMTLFQPLEKKK